MKLAITYVLSSRHYAASKAGAAQWRNVMAARNAIVDAALVMIAPIRFAHDPGIEQLITAGFGSCAMPRPKSTLSSTARRRTGV